MSELFGKENILRCLEKGIAEKELEKVSERRKREKEKNKRIPPLSSTSDTQVLHRSVPGPTTRRPHPALPTKHVHQSKPPRFAYQWIKKEIIVIQYLMKTITFNFTYHFSEACACYASSDCNNMILTRFLNCVSVMSFIISGGKWTLNWFQYWGAL